MIAIVTSQMCVQDLYIIEVLVSFHGMSTTHVSAFLLDRHTSAN